MPRKDGTYDKAKKRLADQARYAREVNTPAGLEKIVALRKKADAKRSGGSSRERDRRDSRLWSNFGIRRKDYDQMLQEQGFICAICEAPAWAERHGVLQVDHDHETGKLRALLCVRCNLGVGYFADVPARLRAAADYLEKFRG